MRVCALACVHVCFCACVLGGVSCTASITDHTYSLNFPPTSKVVEPPLTFLITDPHCFPPVLQSMEAWISRLFPLSAILFILGFCLASLPVQCQI